ncbi:MAG: MBL fold metallo-hydrolase [Gammaproteobacteria bacterium]|nr:MBL fold metallo-hydrolase [Gammaproteobacteria bacterium]
MRIASLGSGSRGNATLVQHEQTTLLVDCGFSLRETERRLDEYGVAASDIDAVLVTHEHGDHIRGAGAFCRKHATPLYMTHGTYRASDMFEQSSCLEIMASESFAIKDISILPFAVPHDAAEPCQFVFSDGDIRIGLLTDTGMITPHIVDMLSGCHALLLECNHDLDMLQQGEYPPSLKQRVGGDYGHLNNSQAASLLGQMDCSRLCYVAAMHLSDKNNKPSLARQALSKALNWRVNDILVADQDNGLDWFLLN